MIKEKIIFGIDRKEISHFTSIELQQTINIHHTFAIKVPHSVIEKPRAYTMENAQNWLGKVVHIQLENKNNFLGIITNIELDFNLDHVGSQIILTGFSKTILLESGTKMHSWEDTTLQDMVREVIKSGANEQLQNEIQPEFTHKINYQTQYEETDFQYIQRLAKQYNEWLYYDGEKLFFGKPKNIREKERIALTFGQDLYTFKLGVKAKQTQFGAFTYNEDYNKLYKVQTQHKVEGLPRLGDQAFEASEKLYNTTSLEYGRIPTGDEGFLETILKKRQEAAMADANYITATSGNNKLKIGSIITINAKEEIEVNSAHRLGLDATKTNFQTQEVGTYIITEINHKATDIGEYENNFKALPAFIKTLPEAQVAFPQAQNQQAIVIDNADPKGQGRIRVKMQWQQTKNLRTQWIRVMTPDAGTSGEVPTNRGFVFIPEIGDQVMLGFRYNDPNRPFAMGSLFNGQTGKGGGANNYLKSIFTRGGSTFTFNELDNSILVKDPSGNTWFMDGNGNISVTAPKNITMNAGDNITMNATDILLNTKNNYLIDVANKMNTKVGTKILTQSNDFKQVVSGSTSLFSGKTLINSTDGEVKIEAKELTASGKKSILLHSDEKLTANSKGDLHIKGEKGNKQTNTATTYTPSDAEKIDAKCIAHFRPTEKFEYEYGFDYMQLGNKIYGGINFYEQIIEEKINGKVANHKNFEKLAQEYNPLPISFRPNDPEKEAVLQNYFCSWLSMYPNSDPAGKSTVTLNMLFEASEDMTKPFELEYNTEFFDITPTTFPPIKKTREGKAVEVENAITITCKKGFNGEYDKTKEINPAEIRVVITSDTEKDDHDQPIKHLAGKLLIKPNSDHDRRKTNVRFVQVLCKTEDEKYLDKNVKIEDVKAGLSNKCLSHFLIKPEFEADVKVLDLTSKSATMDKFLQANPDKTSSLFGSDDKLVRDGDGFYNFIKDEYNKEFNPVANSYDYTDFMGVVIFFINYIWLEKYSITNTYNGTSTEVETTAGYAGSKLALIFKNGFNQRTIGHETLHTLNLDHTFEKGSKHVFNKSSTKNIMDYTKQNESGKDKIETYKWQWDIINEDNDRHLVKIDEWENYKKENEERLKQIEQDKKEAEEKAKKDQSYRNSPNYFNTLDV